MFLPEKLDVLPKFIKGILLLAGKGFIVIVIEAMYGFLYSSLTITVEPRKRMENWSY